MRCAKVCNKTYHWSFKESEPEPRNPPGKVFSRGLDSVINKKFFFLL